MRNYVILLIMSALIGFILLLIVYAIPNQKGSRIYQNVAESMDMLERFSEKPVLLDEFENAHIDYYTDSLMMNEIVYNGNESIVEKALLIPAYDMQEGGWLGSLKNYLATGENEGGYVENYARYWHGYLVIIKPLFIFFSYQELLNINQFLQLALLVCVALLIKRKCGINYILPYLFSVFCLMPITIAMSFQFSNMFYITMIASVLYLQYGNSMEKRQILPEFFMIVGIITAYMDFLTYPLLAVGMLLVFDIICNRQDNVWKQMQRLILFTLCWGAGYFGMWISKWILVSICMQYDIFKEALGMIRYRMEYAVAEETITYSKVIKYNIFYIFAKVSYVVPFVAIAIYYIIRIVLQIKIKAVNWKCVCSYAYVTLLPFIWYAFTANHSCQHNYFTNRTAVVAIFAGFCMLAQLGEKTYRIQNPTNKANNKGKR